MFDVTIYEKDGKRNFIDYVKQITSLNDNVVIDIDMGYGDTKTKIFDKTTVMTITAKFMPEIEQESIIDKIKAEINKLTVYYTTKDKGINLISQNAVNRIFDKYMTVKELDNEQSND